MAVRFDSPEQRRVVSRTSEHFASSEMPHGLATGRASPSELLAETLERVEAEAGSLDCYLNVMGEYAEARARELERIPVGDRTPLWGDPDVGQGLLRNDQRPDPRPVRRSPQLHAEHDSDAVRSFATPAL